MRIEEAYRVVLFGHRDFYGHRLLEERLCSLLKNILCTHSFLEIYIGRNGEFDRYVASVVKHLKAVVGEERIALYCVLPYPEKDMEYYENYYDGVMIPGHIERVHPKGAIEKRNRWMVEQADLVVGYVERDSGGACAALRYAEKHGKNIINLA